MILKFSAMFKKHILDRVLFFVLSVGVIKYYCDIIIRGQTGHVFRTSVREKLETKV